MSNLFVRSCCLGRLHICANKFFANLRKWFVCAIAQMVDLTFWMGGQAGIFRESGHAVWFRALARLLQIVPEHPTCR